MRGAVQYERRLVTLKLSCVQPEIEELGRLCLTLDLIRWLCKLRLAPLNARVTSHLVRIKAHVSDRVK